MIPANNPQAAAEEVYHLAELKLPEAMILAAQAEPGFWSPEWEPL